MSMGLHVPYITYYKPMGDPHTSALDRGWAYNACVLIIYHIMSARSAKERLTPHTPVEHIISAKFKIRRIVLINFGQRTTYTVKVHSKFGHWNLATLRAYKGLPIP